MQNCCSLGYCICLMKNWKPTPVKYSPGFYLSEWSGPLYAEPFFMFTHTGMEQPLVYRCCLDRVEGKRQKPARAIRASFALLLMFCQQNQKVAPKRISLNSYRGAKTKVADMAHYLAIESDLKAQLLALTVFRPAFKNEILIADFFEWYGACALQFEKVAWRKDFLSDWLALLLCYEALPGHQPYEGHKDVLNITDLGIYPSDIGEE